MAEAALSAYVFAVRQAQIAFVGHFSVKEKTYKHKQICGIVPGLGGCQKFVYVFFSGHSLWGEKHVNRIPPKIPGQSRDNFVCVFFSLCVSFSLLILRQNRG